MGDWWADQVAAAAHGETEAFLRIYDLTAAEVRGYVLALGVHGADNRVQNAYVRYWVHLPSLTAQSKAQVVRWLILTACTTQDVDRDEDPGPNP